MGKRDKNISKTMANTSGKKLNLGCGKDYRQGWVNLDAVASVKPDVVHDISKPLPFKDQSFDFILAQDILEHFTKEDVVLVIGEIARTLRVGGQVEIRVPNVTDIVNRFTDDEETRNEFLYGTTFETGVFGAHKVGFTAVRLVSMMSLANLELVRLKEEETNFVGIFKKVLPSKKTKQLVYVNQTLGMGGAEVFMVDLLGALQKNNWSVVVYTNNQSFAHLLEQKQIVVKKITTIVDVIGDWKGLVKGVFLWPKLLAEYWKVVRKHHNADLFLMSGFIEKILVSPLLVLVKKPSCWIEFGPMETIFAKFFRLPKVLYFLVKSLPEKVVTSSYHSRRSLTSSARISLAKLRIVPCGRNVESQNVGVTKSSTIVCVSRLEPGKGQDLLIDAFSLIAKKNPQLKLKIVGEGDFLPILQEKVNQNNLQEKVVFAGRVKNALQEMVSAEVVVFPSVWPLEGFGLVMIEAMSLGKPIVAFDRGPGNEIIEDEKTGLLAKDGDIVDLAKKIEKLLHDKKLAESLGKTAQQSYLSKYQIESVADHYEQIFLEAIADHKAKSVLTQN